MPFMLCPYRRFPVQCNVANNAGLFVKLPLASCSGFGSVKPVEGGLIPRWKEISTLYGTR